MKRTITITTSPEKLLKALENLKLSKEFCKNAVFTLDLEIEETKENYKYLSTTEDILDWSFEDEGENKINTVEEKETIQVCDISSPSNCPCNTYDSLVGTLEGFGIKNYTDLLGFFLGVWKSKRENRFLSLDSETILGPVRYHYLLEKPRSSFSSDLEFSVSGAYMGMMMDRSVYSDVILRLNPVWDMIHEYPTFESMMNNIYR